ncbi:hypothetical protein [Embleya scabrispora]|uniref:hypothetical protein n=1 Tax=Embleya scabrispora TaxID=159449 RepID=UPI00117D282E|nr:hypothetical protein [Embleya scabrispora]
MNPALGVRVAGPRRPEWRSCTPRLRWPGLEVDAELVARRNGRSHHRFEDDPDNVTRELDLYEEAITILRTMAVPVLRRDTDRHPREYRHHDRAHRRDRLDRPAAVA